MQSHWKTHGLDQMSACKEHASRLFPEPRSALGGFDHLAESDSSLDLPHAGVVSRAVLLPPHSTADALI